MHQNDDAETPDSLDALMRAAAHVSTPPVARRALFAPGAALAGGRLAIVRKLGEGGMGMVYEAFDTERNARVALKTLSRVHAAGVYRLKNEFRALADVTHPNLVRLYELFVQDEDWFFTMELIEGEHFDRWVRPSGQLAEPRLRQALAQLVAGMVAVHAAGKLHRDLKPSNVLVTREGRVVVLDFGLSSDPELGGVGYTLADDSVSGTPAYMAPEQAAGRPATAASDHYAIGVMLFEALTGRLPFEGRPHEMLTDKQRRDAPSPASVKEDLPADLAELCTQLITRVASERAATASLRAAGVPQVEPQHVRRTSQNPSAAPLLFGRETELAALREAFEVTLAGSPLTVFVSGASGMGKSTLIEGFLATLRARGGVVVLSGRCYERENVPYKGIDALIDALSRYLRKLSLAEATALLPREVPALARLFPVLERIDAVAAAPKRDIPDPQELKRRAFEASAELLARIRDRHPLVLVIDDLQWIDEDAMRFMRAMLLHPAPAPALLLCAHRSEAAADNPQLKSVREAAATRTLRTIEVGPLDRPALVALAQHLLPSVRDQARIDAFADEAQGSPFFAGELARAVPLRAPDAPLPALVDALALHIASLPETGQRLLALLALAGQPLKPSVAVVASGAPDGHALLDRLRSEQLVRVSFDGAGERRLECYHDKIREQLTASTPGEATRELAQSLATALVADGSDEDELLARLLVLAGDRGKAAQHSVRGAERAFAALAFERAASLYEQALAHGEFVEAEQRRLRSAHGEALANAGLGARAAEAFLAAAEGAREEEAVELTRRAGHQYLMCGEQQRGRNLLARALGRLGISFPRHWAAALASLLWWRLRLALRGLRYRARETHSPREQRELELLSDLTHALVRTDFFYAALFCSRLLLRALQSGHELMIGRALAWEHLLLGQVSSPEATGKRCALCERLGTKTNDSTTQVQFLFAQAQHHWSVKGDSMGALAFAERTLNAARATPTPHSSHDRPWHEWMKETALVLDGRVVEVGERCLALLEEVERRGDSTVGACLVVLASLALLGEDKADAAVEVFDRATARRNLEPNSSAELMWLLMGTILMAYRGDARTAWYDNLAARERHFRSLQARLLGAGTLEHYTCGIAVAAALRASEPRERRGLERAAKRLARRARNNRMSVYGVPAAALACLRGQRAEAVAALRRYLQQPQPPLYRALANRRLGEVLGGSEGAGLIAEADALLRAGGVVNPARLAAALFPGIELA